MNNVDKENNDIIIQLTTISQYKKTFFSLATGSIK